MKGINKITVKKITDFILEMLYPERCVVCDETIDYRSDGICEKCKDKLNKITDRCFKCGKQLDDDNLEFCNDCLKSSHKFIRGYPVYVYNDSIRKSIYRFKYANRRHYASFYGREMAKELESTIKKISPDALIPVPLHKKKLKMRGYNQAELLAQELGKYLNIPVLSNYLIRVKNTKPLKLLDPVERQNNLKKAFKIAQNDVKLDTIVIVDDIYTTGSTVDEISGILLESGVKNIYFVSLASGVNI